MHENVVDFLHDLLDVVPTNECLGNFLWVKDPLIAIRKRMVEKGPRYSQKTKANMLSVCMDCILKTMTWPVKGTSWKRPQSHLMKAEILLWRDAMLKECHSLVHETITIEPVDLSTLDQENVEFVSGKVVTVWKTGPNPTWDCCYAACLEFKFWSTR